MAKALGTKATSANKLFWKIIAFRLLGLNGQSADGFEKADCIIRRGTYIPPTE